MILKVENKDSVAIALVSGEHFAPFWEDIKVGLGEAIEESHGEVSPETVYGMVSTGRWVCWIASTEEDKSAGFAVGEAIATEKGLYLNIPFAWVDSDLGCGNHIAEDATPAFEQARDLALRSCLEDMLVDVEAALTKFEAGRYGICERCGCEIDWARLEAKPQARLCIRCQHRSELGH